MNEIISISIIGLVFLRNIHLSYRIVNFNEKEQKVVDQELKLKAIEVLKEELLISRIKHENNLKAIEVLKEESRLKQRDAETIRMKSRADLNKSIGDSLNFINNKYFKKKE